MNIKPIRFAAIKHPVRIDPQTGEKDTGPVHRKEQIGATHISTFDLYQQASATNYVREAYYLDNDRHAFAVEGPGQRKYAMLGEDAKAMSKLLGEDEELNRLNQKVEEAENALAAAEEARQLRIHAVVKNYLDQHADRVEEVPYKYDYRTSPPSALEKQSSRLKHALLTLITLGLYKPKQDA